MAALDYADRGWPIFPCDQRKKPLNSNGFKGATTDPAKLREWWAKWPLANPATEPGAAGFMVLDSDPGLDRAEAHRAMGGIPETKMKATTPRGGTHEWFALREGEEVRPSASRIAPKLDIRGHGSYVLLPPSHVLDADKGIDGTYTWGDFPVPGAAFRTDGMIEACKPRRAKSDSQEWIIEPDLPENIGAAIDWLNSDKCRPASEGSGGDSATYDTACMMRSFGLSPETALELMNDVYNSKCFPPWDIEPLTAKVRNAYEYATSAPGNMTDAYRKAKVAQYFKPVQRETEGGGHEAQAGRYRFADRSAIDAIPDPAWLIPDLLTQGAHALLVAPRGSFKSFLAIDIAASVAVGSGAGQGRAWPDVVQRGPVLYALGEGRSGMKKRLGAWEKRHNEGRHVPDLILVDPVPLVMAGEEDWQGFIDEALRWHNEYALVILDTASRAMQGLNDNASQDASRLTQLVQMLQAQLGAAVLILAHAPHGDAGRMKGSVAFEGDADMVLTLHREGKNRSFTGTMTKQKEASEWEKPRTFMMEVLDDTLVCVVGGDTGAASPDGNGAKVSRDTKPPPSPFKPVAEIASGTVDKAVQRALEANPSRAWSTGDLAGVVTADPAIDISSSTLRQVTLIKLRENKASYSHRAYNPITKRWRFVK